MTHEIGFSISPKRSGMQTRSGSKVYITAITLCLWVWAMGLGYAQTTGRANLTGVVADPKGAVVVGAQVTVTNTKTNVTSVSATNGTGYFEIDSLDAGIYKVTVAAPGFEGLVQSAVELRASAVVSLPLTLKLGMAKDVVTVTSLAPLIDAQSGLTGQSLTTKEIESLPAADNNPMEFVEIAPGVQSPAGVTQAYSIEGAINWNGVSKFGTAGVSNVNEFNVDGSPNAGNTRGNALVMNSDMTDAVRIDTTAFDPALGHTYGITMTQTTKTGTNKLHGSVTESYGNRRWDAMNHFQSLLYQHQLAGAGCTNGPATSPACYAIENSFGWPGVHENLTTFGIGGPVFIPKLFDGRDKLFWFVGGTNDSLTDANFATATIPTVQERSGDFSDLPTSTLPGSYAAAFAAACPAGTPFYGQYQIYDPYSVTVVGGHPVRRPLCGNKVPANHLRNATMAALVNSWLPTPTNAGTTGGNYVYTAPSPSHFMQFTERVDFAIREHDRVFVRFTRNTFTQALPGLAPGGIDTRQGPKWVELAALGWNHVFNASTNLDVTFAGSNMETSYNNYPGYAAYPPASDGLPGYLQEYAGATATFPELVFGNNAYQQGTSGAQLSLFGNAPNSPSFYRTDTVRANLTHVFGAHAFRIGGEWRAQNYARSTIGTSSGVFNFDTSFTREDDGTTGVVPTPNNSGLSYAAFLMGVQSNAAATKQATVSLSTPYYSAYLGDTWRVTPKLTFMPGLRFEEEYGPKEKHNLMISGFDPNQSLAISAPAIAAYASSYAGATPAQQAVMPSTINVAGGPLYAGVNGAPVRAWRGDFRVLPRIAASYRVAHDTVIHAGYGLFFDTLNALESSGGSPFPDQTNFTASTSVATSSSIYGPLGFGENLSLANPTPLSNPFPPQNGSNFVAAVGAAAGNLSYLGANPTVFPRNYAPARAQRVEIGVQHQFGRALMVDVSWLGSWASHMSNLSSGLVNAGGGGATGNQNLSALPGSFYAGGNQPNFAMNTLLATKVNNPFALANFSALQSSNPAAYNQMAHSGIYTAATVPISSVVRPYAQMGGLSMMNPIGTSNFQELQVTVVKRLSNGLDFTVAYQKNYQYDRDYFANPFDTAMTSEPTNTSLPYRLTVEGLYELPFGHNKKWAHSSLMSTVFGGFSVAGTYELNPGQLIEFPANFFYIGTPKASDIVLKKPTYSNVFGTGATAAPYVQWLNPANMATATQPVAAGPCTYTGTGFVNPGNTTCTPLLNLRPFPQRINGVRTQTINNVMGSLKKSIPIKEGVGLELRANVANLFNRQMLGTPNTTVSSLNFGQITSTQDNARFITIDGHIRF
jgi:hypothetical protein